ncbi:DUF2905 domain-containing protein [bacterium]|jgi:hypothetical protein|nr:DUF2905 domain-containing protein [bacterium]
MSHETLGRVLMLVGAGVLGLGAVVYFLGGRLGWFGRLPGDISFRGENVQFYFPLTTLLLVNALIWLVLRLIAWLKDR